MVPKKKKMRLMVCKTNGKKYSPQKGISMLGEKASVSRGVCGTGRTSWLNQESEGDKSEFARWTNPNLGEKEKIPKGVKKFEAEALMRVGGV